jgi:general secretion pathway protein D
MLSGVLTRGVLAACMALCLAVCAGAQPASEGSSATDSASRGGGIPIAQLLATVAKSSGKKFIVDPRVRAEVSLVGINPSSVSYAQLLEILQVHGFVAAEQGGVVLVVPDANARTLGAPLLTERERAIQATSV